jgi:RNA binding exosome subunit
MSSDFHYLAFRTSVHATEDPAKVEQALRAFIGEAPIGETVLEGHHKNPILLWQAELKGRGPIDAFWRKVAEAPGAVARLAAELPERMDDEMNFYLRLSKQDAYLGKAVLARDDDAIHVRAKVAAFPAKGDVARAKMAAFIQKFSGARP